LYPVLRKVEKIAQLPKRWQGQLSKKFDDPWLWYPYFALSVVNAWSTAKAAQSLNPRFVFGQEVTTYGLATALCKGTPKILYPWGHDVFLYSETSLLTFLLTKYALSSADLIIPASVTAADYICERFRIPASKVQPHSWGADKQLFKIARDHERRSICSRWGIDPNATIILNSRRFRPAWGCFIALEAFIQLASENPMTHFIMLGGESTEIYMAEARAKLRAKELLSRFTLCDGEISLNSCAELMAISDIFLSLLTNGDMRSSSVIQATAAGAAPILSDSPEYRYIERLGFTGFFVKPDSVSDILQALRFCLRHPEKRTEIIRQNNLYVAQYEDNAIQKTKLLELIRNVCDLYCTKNHV
jgi:glycosyltransferase involved in cell wall biosynthesis